MRRDQAFLDTRLIGSVIVKVRHPVSLSFSVGHLAQRECNKPSHRVIEHRGSVGYIPRALRECSVMKFKAAAAHLSGSSNATAHPASSKMT